MAVGRQHLKRAQRTQRSCHTSQRHHAASLPLQEADSNNVAVRPERRRQAIEELVGAAPRALQVLAACLQQKGAASLLPSLSMQLSSRQVLGCQLMQEGCILLPVGVRTKGHMTTCCKWLRSSSAACRRRPAAPGSQGLCLLAAAAVGLWPGWGIAGPAPADAGSPAGTPPPVTAPAASARCACLAMHSWNMMRLAWQAASLCRDCC